MEIRDEICEAEQALDTSLPPTLSMKMRFDTQEMAIDGGLAYERGTYMIEAADRANPAAALTLKGRHVHIFRRQADGSWKGWRLMENSTDATPPAAPAAAPAAQAPVPAR